MTSQQYREFQEKFAEFMRVNHFDSLHFTDEEGFFSHMPCDCCNRKKSAGTRYTVTGLTETNHGVGIMSVETFDICQDCVYFAEYGKLDDATMQEIEMQEKSKIAEIQKLGINLDDCTAEELTEFCKMFRTLADYAQAKAIAMNHREQGRINAAINYEKDCEIIYNRLPDSAKW